MYSRPGCHLCEQLIEALIPLLRGRAALDIRNIDTNEEWRSRFDTRIPVVEFRGRILCEARLDRAAIEAAIAAVPAGAGRVHPI